MILNFLPDSSNTVLPYIAKTILYLYLHLYSYDIFYLYSNITQAHNFRKFSNDWIAKKTNQTER